MNITKEYFPEKGIVVVTVENPPLQTTKHTISATSLANGTVVLEDRIAELRAESQEALNIHNAVSALMG